MARPGQRLDAEPLREALEEWVAAGNKPHSLPPGPARAVYAIRHRKQAAVSVGVADELLVLIGRPELLSILYPPPPRPGRAGYTWTKPHPSRRLTTRQLEAAHVLHLAGMSARELARRLWREAGYASEKSCLQGLRLGWRQLGLPVRDRIAATVLASTRHGRAGRDDKNAYRRWRRAQVRAGLAEAWPSDRRR